MAGEPMKVWAVRRYNDVFEDAYSRKLAIPNYLRLIVSHDSEAFLWLMRQGSPGHAAFGDFVATVQILATLGRPARASGVLVSAGRALGPDNIALRLGSIKSVLQRSFELLSDDQCRWLYQTEWNPASTPQNPVSERPTSRHPPGVVPPSSHLPPTFVPGASHARADGPDRNGLDGTVGAVGAAPKAPVRPPGEESVRELLVKLGVDGDALAALSGCSALTPAALLHDIREARKDPAIRSVKRVIVSRLCERYGLVLEKRTAGGLGDSKALSAIQKLRDQAKQRATTEDPQ